MVSNIMMQAEKVVVMLTGSRMKWISQVELLSLSLKPGDQLILLSLLKHIHFNPWHETATLLGFKDKDDHNKVYGSNKRLVEDDVKSRKEDYGQNARIMQLQKLYEIQKVVVSIEVEIGSSRKAAGVRAAKRLGATWIVLDREMKKHQKYFVDRLSCRISRMESNNTIIQLRGPLVDEHVSYGEMIPSYSWEDLSSLPQKSGEGQRRIISRKDASQSSKRPLSNTCKILDSDFQSHVQEAQNNNIFKTRIAQAMSLFHGIKSSKGYQNEACLEQALVEEEFENSICSVCENRRPKIGLQRDFSYRELYDATDGFSEKNYLSEGGFGLVFQGRLKDGLRIAVKQHKAASLQGEKEFKSEVHLLSQARHQNLVMLLGSCTKGSHRLLVYEYVCNGSLDQHLSDDSPEPLSWEKRIKIAVGAAEGLEYLHSRNIIHRDMRPSNILVTHDYQSLLGDFGLAKEQWDDNNVGSSEKEIVGTLGYMAPEYAECGKMSTKTDVYSFGVVLLQLITGLRTTDEIPGGKSFLGWAKPLLESKNYPYLIDRRIVDFHDVHQLFWMVRVAEDCLQNDPTKRCTMKLVVHNLRCIKEGKPDFTGDF